MTFRPIGEEVVDLPPNTVFVFGSNLAGIHGGGAARLARDRFGARSGVGVGRTGLCYALPTKDRRLRTLPLETVRGHVNDFVAHALVHYRWWFCVTAIGTGLAGLRHEDVAPMFALAPPNCSLPGEWEAFLVADVG